MSETLNTKWGNANIDNKGYYVITSYKEGNHLKRLHRLIAEEYFGDWINDSDDFFDIHHIDGDKTNNCILNLEPMPHEDHNRLHSKGENHPNYGKHLSEGTTKKMSEAQNTSGYYRVSKIKNTTYKQGVQWRYQYYENGKHKSINSADTTKLEERVKSKGLPWFKLTEGDAL